MSDVHLPIYCKPPNKLIRYEERPFNDCRFGDPHAGVEVVAIFKDKNGKENEMSAQVKWVHVWDMDKEQWVPLRKWMRWCPHVWTKGINFKEYFEEEKEKHK